MSYPSDRERGQKKVRYEKDNVFVLSGVFGKQP